MDEKIKDELNNYTYSLWFGENYNKDFEQNQTIKMYIWRYRNLIRAVIAFTIVQIAGEIYINKGFTPDAVWSAVVIPIASLLIHRIVRIVKKNAR